MKKTIIKVSGMHCASCVTVLTKALTKTEGVKSANINFSTEKASIEYDPKILDERKLVDTIKKKGYDGHVVKEHDHSIAVDESKKKKELNRLLMSLNRQIFAYTYGKYRKRKK